jgi:carbonic anhydrase/acetyltransferase-like protein (isoleucine patch superfamily)
LGDELTAGLVVGVVSVVEGDCVVRSEHATNPLLKNMTAIANLAHIFGGNIAEFNILLRLTED